MLRNHKILSLIKSSQNIISNNSENITNNSDNISNNGNNISNNSNAINVLQNDITTLNNNVSTNTADITTNTADITTLNNNAATNTADIMTLNNNVSTNTADIMTNTTDIATLNNGPQIVACGKISGSGGIIKGYGISSVTHLSTGKYLCNLSSARPDVNYNIQLTMHEDQGGNGEDSLGIHVINQSVNTGNFQYMIYESDNSSNPGVPTDATHHLTLIDF